MTIDDLKNIYISTCDLFQIKDAEDKWNDITYAYTEDGRYYHNLDHICAMGARINELFHQPTNYGVLWLALIYHDIVYVPGNKNNELRSAVWAIKDISDSRFSTKMDVVASRVAAVIMLTQKHDPSIAEAPSDIAIIDADLYELSTDRYFLNAGNIRKEFHKASDEQWRIGRMDFLESFLSRDTLYSKEAFKGDTRSVKELDEDARHWMMIELNKLRKYNAIFS